MRGNKDGEFATEILLLQTYKHLLPIFRSDFSHLSGCLDSTSLRIQQMFQPAIAQQYSPRSVVGDGYCLYRAVSLSCYGTKEHHLYLRLLTALEILQYRDHYDVTSTSYKGCLVDNRIVTNDYETLISHLIKPGSFSETMHIYALSAALRITLAVYCLPQTMFQSPFTRIVAGRNVKATENPSATIMWTQMSIPRTHTQFSPNHFVSLHKLTSLAPVVANEV